MTELERSLTADSAFASPRHILGDIEPELAARTHPGAPHTIYAELWHIAFWQRISIDWLNCIETPIPVHAADGFPTLSQIAAEPWPSLLTRFFTELEEAAVIIRAPERLHQLIRCPSPSGKSIRIMSVEDQLISLAAHNAYHLGRIVLLRQLAGTWPPAAGGFTW